MDWIVTTARTVEEAQTRALDLLGVDGADAEIQVIEEGKTGLFGRTKTEARVRARIKPKAPPAKDERRQGRGDRNRSRGGKGGGGQNRNRNNNNRGGGKSEGGNRDGGNRGGQNRNRNNNNRGGGKSEGGNRDGGNRDNGRKEAVAAGAAAASSGGGRNSGDRNSGDRNSGDRNSGDRNSGDRNSGGRNSGDRNSGGNKQGNGGGRGRRGGRGGDQRNEDRVEMPVEEQRETLENFVKGVAAGFDPTAKVTLVEEGTTLQAQVHGDDLGRLVGAKASTLQSLEELARTAMHRAAAGRRYHRIQVDVDDYRARRREALANFARGIAEQVADSGESKAMEPMGAADRKLIHDAVADVQGVETYSEGRDPRRYIVIAPTNAAADEEE